MPDTLAQKIRAKYPGVYDDLSDTDLEAKVTAKYPGVYDDIPKTPPTFSAANEKDTEGNAVVDPNTIGTAVRHFTSGINPIQAGQMLPFPKALGGSGMDNPLLPSNIARDMHAVKKEADERWAKGDYPGAVAKYLESFIPILGPMMSHQGNELEQGKYAAFLGDAAALATNAAAPEVVKRVGVRTPALANTNPVEADAIAAGQARGIPVDAGTATGNRFVRSVQSGVDQTPIGAVVAERAKGAQAQALIRVGGELADQVHPSPVTPEQAGAALKGSTEDLIRTLDQQADQAYGKLREIEEKPEHAKTLQTAPEGSPKFQQILGKLSKGWKSADQPVDGGVAEGGTVPVRPTRPELIVMRQIEAELDAQPYQRGKQVVDDLDTGATHYARGSRNADVYHDLHSAMGYFDTKGQGPSGATMLNDIRETLKTGEWNTASKAAYRVAQDRLRRGLGTLTGPSLPQGAAILGTTEDVALPVDLRPAKKSLQPIYDRLQRESQLIPLMGDKARGFVALDRLMNGPDFAPVSVVDSGLSDLKAMSRGAAMPELRSQGQGLAAAAVKSLEDQVQSAVKRAGPDAVQALEQGRTAVKTKAAVASVLEDIKSEPVKAYRSATAPKDTAVEHLRQLQQVAPDVVPQVGRAWLEDALTTATGQGGFEHAAKLDADWRRLGPQTKQLIFGGPENVKALDQYFLLAKKLAESPNPSGTAKMGTSMASGALIFTHPAVGVPLTLGAGALSKILRSPGAVKLLTKGLQLQLGPGRASQTAAMLGAADVIRAAQEAGVMVPSPARAGDQPPGGAPQ